MHRYYLPHSHVVTQTHKNPETGSGPLLLNTLGFNQDSMDRHADRQMDGQTIPSALSPCFAVDNKHFKSVSHVRWHRSLMFLDKVGNCELIDCLYLLMFSMQNQ